MGHKPATAGALSHFSFSFDLGQCPGEADAPAEGLSERVKLTCPRDGSERPCQRTPRERRCISGAKSCCYSPPPLGAEIGRISRPAFTEVAGAPLNALAVSRGTRKLPGGPACHRNSYRYLPLTGHNRRLHAGIDQLPHAAEVSALPLRVSAKITSRSGSDIDH